MSVIIANVGLPMIAWQLPVMIAAYLPVVAIESVVAYFVARRSVRSTVSGIAIANLCSTLLGIPSAWILMLVLHMIGTGGTGGPGFDSPLDAMTTVVLGAAWLAPRPEEFHWLVPAATLVLLVPYFLASVISERLVLQWIWGSDARPVAIRTAWIINAASYAVLVLVAVVWLLRELKA